MEDKTITIFGKKLKKLEFPPSHSDEYLEYLKTCDFTTKGTMINANNSISDWTNIFNKGR